MRIAADPGALGAAGVQQADIAARLAELSSSLTSAASSASAAGDPTLAEALTGAVQSWQASLAMVADSVQGGATNLGAAGSAYATTDETAIPAG